MNTAVLEKPLVLALACIAPLVGQDFDTYAVNKLVGEAEYGFSNESMYRNEEKWLGKTIALLGTVVEQPVIVRGRDMIQLVGSETGEYANVVVFLDHALPQPAQSFSQETRPTISRGQAVRVFGKAMKCQEFVNKYGQRYYLPTLEGLLIFFREDDSYRQPVWVSLALRKIR